MKKLMYRYDYAIAGIEALQAYINTSCTEADTISLLQDCKSAIESLEEMELGTICKQSRKITAKPKLSSVLREYEDRSAKLQPVIGRMENFMAENGKNLGELMRLGKAALQINVMYQMIKNIDVKLTERIHRATQEQVEM